MLTNDEKETHFNLVASNRKVYQVYSDDEVMQRKLAAIGAKVIRKEASGGIHYELDAKQITLRKKRVLSAEQKAKLSERMKRIQRKVGAEK